jgi:spore photoproduct lyase
MHIDTLFIEKGLAENTLAQRVVGYFNVPTHFVTQAEEVYNWVNRGGDSIAEGKKALYLRENRGLFIKECPGTSHYTCCGYKILHIGTYCTMDCAYCILQSYFHPPVLQFFINQDQLFKELESHLRHSKIQRFGTGEFTDSLIWEPWSGLAQKLIACFAEQDKAVLELKTKTTAISGLLKRAHNRKTITAWSLNTDRIIRNEERGTASLSARLQAAAQCGRHGYPLAFHFDPVFIYDNCHEEYREAIERLFRHVSAGQIVWISMGTFRFMPSLKPIIRHRFDQSRIVYGEFIPGLDNKMRYFKPLRIEMYRHLVHCIREYAPDVTIYLCMEDDEVWRQSFGFAPAEEGGLSRMLDQSARKHCNLDP